MEALINWLNVWFGQKAPVLPTKAREIIVKIAPWLALIMIVMAAPAVLALIGLGGYLGRYAMYGSYGGGWFWIFSAAIILLNILALPGLFKPSKSGWTYSLYAVLVSGAANLLRGDIMGLLVGLIVGFYILFQIKSYYFGGGAITYSAPPTTPTV
ncbi:MAG: hypothetical protein Q7R62_02560 [bacterium]|nr:hypothetical protein [bacterium]